MVILSVMLQQDWILPSIFMFSRGSPRKQVLIQRNECKYHKDILHMTKRVSKKQYPLPWASGLPVAIQCPWNLDPSVHWNATGEMPVCFQWSPSGFQVVFQCVPIMQIYTGSPLGHHWVLASVSVVPVAFQCTYGSSGLPVCSNYAN